MTPVADATRFKERFTGAPGRGEGMSYRKQAVIGCLKRLVSSGKLTTGLRKLTIG